MGINTIKFPGLGIEFELNPVALELGPFSIHWYGISFALAFALGIILALRHAPKYNIKQDDIIDMVLVAAPVSIICARLFYVIFNLKYYLNEPAEIIKIWHGGMALYGSLLGGLMAAILFCKKRKIRMLNYLDFCIPYFALGQVIGRWGNFVNQEVFGRNTTLPWGMTGGKIQQSLRLESIPGVNPELPVHPTFLYESLWNLGVFIILLVFRRNKKRDGEVFYLYMLLYGLGRAWVEPIRTDNLMLGNLRINMVLAIIFFIMFSIVLIRSRIKGKTEESGESGIPDKDKVYAEIIKKIKEEENQIDLDSNASLENHTDEASIKTVPDADAQDNEDNISETEILITDKMGMASENKNVVLDSVQEK